MSLSLLLCIGFIVLGAIALTLFLLEKIRNYSVKAAMIKSVTSLLFIATCAVGLYKNGSHKLALFVILGLLLGLLGDIWLDFKYVYKENDKPFTYAGFTMFGLGHLLYIAGMIVEYVNKDTNPLYVIIPIAVGILAGVVNVLLEKIMKLEFKEMKWIVCLYGAILFSMMFTAISFSIMTQFQNATLIMIAAGGILFAISDLVLSGTYFGQGKERPVDIIINSVTYYMAQYTIAFAVFFI